MIKTLEKQIEEILLSNSVELTTKGEISIPEKDDFLWSGDFEDVSKEIVRLVKRSDVK